MIVVIQDANILIDLFNTGLLEPYFCLGFETHITDLVLAEVRGPVDPFIRRGQLRVKTYSEAEIALLLEFKANQPRSLSLEDCSVLQVAIQKSAILLTGDGALRAHAQARGVDTRGVLWLLDLMVERNILKLPAAVGFLKKLMASNSRLPSEECNLRLRTWAAGRSVPPRPVRD